MKTILHSMSCEYPEGCSCGASKLNKLNEDNERLRRIIQENEISDKPIKEPES